MDFVNGNIRKIYFRYLAAAFGSAMITSVYSIVDMAMVDQYQGPDGTAALAVAAPVWNVIYSLGLLMGIGGSVIFSIERGSSEKQSGREDQYFTAAVIGSVVSFVVMLTHYFLSGNFAAQGVLCGVGLCGVEHPQVHQSTPGTLSIKIPRSFQSSYSVCSGVS